MWQTYLSNLSYPIYTKSYDFSYKLRPWIYFY